MALHRRPRPAARPPLSAGWVVVDGLPVFHRSCIEAGADAPTIVHVHGFGISGRYLEPAAARLATRYRTFVPDLPGMGRSLRPDRPLDIPGLARALIHYCDAVGVERATFVGNSLGCPLLVETATCFPERIDRAVLVSPAGGPNNQPLGRAVRQMAFDAPREPIALLPIATRDYLRFGVMQGFALFLAMTRYPTLERLPNLVAPTLVIAGARDPLVDVRRVHVLAVLPHVDVVVVEGAHALNFSRPELVADLIDAHCNGAPLRSDHGTARVLDVPDRLVRTASGPGTA
jgi:pimeloyl-ACP methyl ester carboxylesterase